MYQLVFYLHRYISISFWGISVVHDVQWVYGYRMDTELSLINIPETRT